MIQKEIRRKVRKAQEEDYKEKRKEIEDLYKKHDSTHIRKLKSC